MRCAPSFVWMLFLFLSLSTLGISGESWIVEHYDPIVYDPSLDLKQVIDNTVKIYPQSVMVDAMRQESTALHRRGNSILSGAPALSVKYGSDKPFDDTGYREVEAAFDLPLWNWGQRAAGKALAENAEIDATSYARALRYRVSGLVREALWSMALLENKHELTKQVLAVSDRLVNTVKRRVELGDLPRADLLLSMSNRLEKRSALNQAEAELMHARTLYQSLTGSKQAPALFEEAKSARNEIVQDHPLLVASNSRIERYKAELKWVRSIGSGSPSLEFGSKHERDLRGEATIDSLNITVSIPFGGDSHAATEIATSNLVLTEAISQRNTLVRKLERELHEIHHAIDIDKAELSIADKRKELAKDYLRISTIGFDSGEIKLIDLLKIQADAYAAILNAKERGILHQRNIARYNQVVGETP